MLICTVHFYSFLLFDFFWCLRSNEKSGCMKDFKTSSFTVIQVIKLKVPPWASKAPVACLHNLSLILFLKVMQFHEQICFGIFVEGQFHLHKCKVWYICSKESMSTKAASCLLVHNMLVYSSSFFLFYFFPVRCNFGGENTTVAPPWYIYLKSKKELLKILLTLLEPACVPIIALIALASNGKSVSFTALMHLLLQ